MNQTHITIIAAELGLRETQVHATMLLLDDDATVPFISRYRKEATGSLDEVQIAAIRDRLEQLRELDKRREAILKSLAEQEKLTPELEQAVTNATTMAELEDIYLPYKPKRRTRATIAKEKGLEPLAHLLLAQGNEDPENEATHFINPEKEVHTTEEALAGARDIIAEWISENAEVRSTLRDLFAKKAEITSQIIKGKEEAAQKFKDYFNWQEPIATIPSHRLLAILRGANEEFLRIKLTGTELQATQLIAKLYIKNSTKAAEQVQLSLADSYDRLLHPSLETETLNHAKDLADEQAIKVFADNLRELLLAAPLGHKRVLALDPGFRTGCKVVCLDAQGKLLVNHTIYPHEPNGDPVQAGKELLTLIKKCECEAIAIGNGTAGRETEAFVRKLGITMPIVMVNESGASIYSASAVAREEFPDHDVTVRGSVSIGRRLLDPLAELVKLDPKSIGVGQYQHDVNQKWLKQGLDDVVMSCVNAVGVDVNTASKQILTYISGLGPKLAQNIVDYRNENGPFPSRAALKKVPKLGSKAFEQAAGFLRIPNAKNPLDTSAVHPESYIIVEKMAKDLDCTVAELIKDAGLRENIEINTYVTDKVGIPTLTDIVQELEKPGRDPRQQFETFEFSKDVHDINDLVVGMELPGIITNVTNFGAFVDIGVHQDGLVHISELADTYVSDPTTYVKVAQKVKVKVLEIDKDRHRIALSMKGQAKANTTTERTPTPPSRKPLIQSSKPEKQKSETVPLSDWQKKLMAMRDKLG